MGENFHKGHRLRVKSKYIKNGLQSFLDHEILELILFYCYPMVDTNEKAHKILNEFGSLPNLFEASVSEIIDKCNITENAAILISLILPLNQKYFSDKWDKKVMLNTSKKAGNFAVSLFIDKTEEHFYLICLDNNRRLIHAPLVSKGVINEAHIHPRRVVELCINFKASSVFLTHNHPSGNLEPSDQDIITTNILKKILDPIGIEVLDHIVVSGTNYVSFAERKLI